MIPRLGLPELILILVIALVIFGPSKLPEVGKSVGKALKEFKSQTNKVTKDITQDDEEDKDNTTKDNDN